LLHVGSVLDSGVHRNDGWSGLPRTRSWHGRGQPT
jgi:hypothetical protein